MSIADQSCPKHRAKREIKRRRGARRPRQPARRSFKVWIFHEVEWGNETGERCSPLQVCSRKIVGLAVFLFNFQVTFGVRHWVLCPWLRIHKIANARPRPDTSTLQPVPETHLGFTKSQDLYVPASIKTLSTYPENHPFCCIKNATIAEMLPN